MNLTQQIWSLKHFLEFISAECSFINVGETFTNTIHLLHRKDHYDLLKLRNQNKTQESVKISRERLATFFS